MKLRNKKTGEVFDALIRERGCAGSYSIIVCDIKSYEHSKSTLDATHFVLGEYNSLAELNEEWEDYTPKEPLIKDKKIRKAVRAWAEANDITEINVASSGYELWGGIDDWCIHFGGNPFKDIKPLKYTIDELCGEEEE